MIAIVNVGPHDSVDPGGERDYEVKINHRVVARFKHFMRDGAAVCLEKASWAVADMQKKEKLALIEGVQKELKGLIRI